MLQNILFSVKEVPVHYAVQQINVVTSYGRTNWWSHNLNSWPLMFVAFSRGVVSTLSDGSVPLYVIIFFTWSGKFSETLGKNPYVNQQVTSMEHQYYGLYTMKELTIDSRVTLKLPKYVLNLVSGVLKRHVIISIVDKILKGCYKQNR